MKKCSACGLEGVACKTVAEASRCANNPKSGKSKAARFGIASIFILILGFLIFGCTPTSDNQAPAATYASQNGIGEYFENVPEEETLRLLNEGTALGKEYIATKRRNGNYDIQQVNFKPSN